MIRFALLLAALLVGAPGTVAAQERLALDAVLASVQRHPKLVAAEAAAARAGGEALSAQGAFDPNLKGSFGGRPLGYYDQWTAKAYVDWQSPLWGASVEGGWRLGQGDFASYEGKAETLGGGELFVGLRVPLLYGGPLDPARAERLEALQGVELAEAEQAALLLDLRAAAEAAYWDWGMAAGARDVAADLLELAQTRMVGLERKVAQGASAPIDLLEARRSVNARQGKLAAAEAKERQAAAKLSLYLRDGAGQPRVAEASAAPVVPMPVVESRPSLVEALDAAWAARPEARLWEAARAGNAVQQRLARVGLLPKLDVQVGASVDLPTAPDPPDRLRQPVLDARLDLAWPTAQRQARGKLIQARSKGDEVAAKAQLARDTLGAELRSLDAQLTAAERLLALAEEGVAIGRAVADAERSRFELGDSDLLFVNLREQSLASAQQQRLAFAAEVLGLRARWRALLGG